MSSKDTEVLVEEVYENPEKPAILFAFDGTIMDTGPAILASYRHTFAHFHRSGQFTKEAAKEVINSPVNAMFAKYMPEEDTKKCVAEYNYYQRNHLIDLIQPMHGAMDLLKMLKEDGYTIGIVSVRERASLVELLQKNNMEHYIDVIIGSSQGSQEQLSEENILLACKLMHAKTCIYISDNANNIRIGKACGTFTIGYINAPQDTMSMADAGPDFLTGDFAQIAKLIHGEPLWYAYEVLYPETEEEKEKRERKERKAAEKKAAKEAEKAAKKAEEKAAKAEKKSSPKKKKEKKSE